VTINRKPGSLFKAFDGMISGKTLHVAPKRLIIQSWRGKHWKPGDRDSTLILSFWPDKNGGRIELAHLNVPAYDYQDVNEGWEKYYWKPWREFLRNVIRLAKAA
jgi:activator of HSP90 ATPase